MESTLASFYNDGRVKYTLAFILLGVFMIAFICSIGGVTSVKTALKILKWLALIVVVGYGLQFMRPARTNPPLDPSQIFSSATGYPAGSAILDRSCQDCHSNTTRWPWYSNVAPVSCL